MATERLYYNDSYLTEFQAQIVDVSPDGRKVYLNRTAFYPTSGGQPFDVGWLGGQDVVEVIDEEDRVAHLLAAPCPEQAVTGKIDWFRRYEHMQQHSGQHLLSAVFEEQFGFSTLSFHMGTEVSTIELGAKEITEPQIAQAEGRANELARNGQAVRVGFEDAAEVEGLRKQSERSGMLRIVEIEGIDKSACGGTHVASLAETLPLQIRKLEKVRGNVRVEFVCGSRASRRMRQDFVILQELARQCATPLDTLPSHVGALRQRLNEADKERQQLGEALSKREGTESHAATVPSPDGLRRAVWEVPTIDERTRAKALGYAGNAKAVVLVVGKQPGGVLIACSADSGINAGAVLKQTLNEFGGRGGGSATLAQGSISDSAVQLALRGKLGFST